MLVLALLLGFFFRFYLLNDIPAGLSNDEADIGYDAYSILATGHDQWGKFLPLTAFQGFGDFRPVLYTYFVIPFIALFDLTSIAIRLPSALFGVAAIGAIYLLGKRLFNARVGGVSALILALSPWAIGLSRTGIESNVAIFFLVLGIYFALGAKESVKNFYIGVLLLAITPYIYSAYFLFFFISLVILFIYLRKIIFSKRNYIIYSALIVFVVLSPLLFHQVTAKTRLSQVGLTSNVNSIGLIDTLNAKRGACELSYHPIACKVLDNKVVLFSSELVKNYLSHFSLSFLYLTGTTTQFSVLYIRGLEYSFGVVFLICGLYSLFRSKKREGFILLGFLLVSPIPDALTGDGHYSRASIMIPFLLLTEGLGAVFLIDFVKKLGKFKRLVTRVVVISIVCFSVISFFATYSTYFRNNYSHYSHHGYKELMEGVARDKNLYSKIYISRHLNDTKQYMYYLLYNKYNPQDYQSKKDIDYLIGDGGWIEVERIGNVYFIASLNSLKMDSEFVKENNLLIAHPSEFPEEVERIGSIKDRMGVSRFDKVELRNFANYVTIDMESGDDEQ